MHGPHMAIHCIGYKTRYGGMSYWLPQAALGDDK